jgi:GGDEF domain-containing protein
MSTIDHDRRYLQDRLREEIDRHARYGHPFAVVVLEALPAADGIPVRQRVDAAIEALRSQLRPSDVIARAFEDVIALLLVETDAAGAHDALLRLRGRLARIGPAAWRITSYNYPKDATRIAALPLATAA